MRNDTFNRNWRNGNYWCFGKCVLGLFLLSVSVFSNDLNAWADGNRKLDKTINATLEDFERLTFGSKFRFQEKNQETDYLVKWNREINFGIWQSKIDDTELRYKNILDFMKYSETDLGIKWNLLDKISGDVDIAVYFISSPEEFVDFYQKLDAKNHSSRDIVKLKKMMKNAIENEFYNVQNGSLCFLSTQKNRRIGFVRSYIMIMDYGSRRRECMFRQFFRSLGFMGNNAGSANSILSEIKKNNRFTEIDKISAKILYDKRMKIGMSRRDSLGVAKKILIEMIGNRVK